MDYVKFVYRPLAARAYLDILLKAAWREYAARLVKLLNEELARLTEEHDALLKK